MKKDYLTVLQNIDREALKAKAEAASALAREYAQQAGEAAGAYAQQAAAAAGEYARDARLRAEEALHSPRAEALAASAKMLGGDGRAAAAGWYAFTTDRVRGFSVLDLAVFKIMMVAFGMWLGAWIASKCSKLAEKLRPVFLGVFCCGFAYVFYRIFFGDRE